MKKALSVLLSLTLLFSMVTCMFQNAVAEPPGTITQDFETGFVTNDPARDPDNTGSSKPNYGTVVTNGGNTYWNVAGIEAGKNIQYLTNAAETGMLKTDGTVYTLTFKFIIHKNTAAANQAVKFTLQTQGGKALGSGSVEKWYNTAYETEWRTVTINNIVMSASDPYTKLRIEGGSGGANGVVGMTVDIDDCVFAPVVDTTPASATVNKKMGTATVSNANVAEGGTVTYTATEYYAGAFDGWYNGETKLTSDKVYSFTYDGTQPLDLIAKFKEDVIAQTFETGFVQNGVQIDRAPDSQASKPTYAVVKNDNTTYLNVAGISSGAKNIQYLTNAEETGMLDTSKTYTLTFKFRIINSTANVMNQAVVFKLQTQNGNNVLGQQIEKWHQADETEWRTATITGIVPNASDLYTKLNISGGIDGVSVDIDDCVFTDAAPTFAASVTVNGKLGFATVDKTKVKEGETVTYTAREYKEGAFDGWYDGTTKVSADKVYTFTYNGTQALDLTAKFIGEAIVQDFEDKNYPLVDPGSTSGTTKIDADCKTGTAAGSVSWNSAGIVKDHEGNGNRYLKVDSNGRWVRFITNNKTGIFTDPTQKITVTFKYRVRNVNNYTGVDGRTLVSLGFFTTTGSTNNYGTQNSANNGKSESPANGVPYVNLPYSAAKDASGEWSYATISNLPYFTDNVELYTANLNSSYTFDLDIDEIIFEKQNATSAQAIGAGSAYVNKIKAENGDAITYTASAPEGVEFYGWFAEDVKVSDDLVYSFTYDGTQKIKLTAKFSDGILQNFEKIEAVNEPNFKRNPDGKEKEYTLWGAEILKEENGNKYINVQGFYDVANLQDAGKTIHYLTNAAETGLLENTNYKVTFKYRVRKGTSETFTEDTKGEKYPNGLTNGNVKVTFLPQDYKGEVASSITNAMISNPNNYVTLEYDAEKEEEWKTVTLFNIPRYKVDGVLSDEGMLKVRIDSNSGYTLDLDDFYFSPITISGDYDELSNWKIYDFISKESQYGTLTMGNIIGEGFEEAASSSKWWASITYNLDKNYLYDDTDEYSIKLKANTQYAATTLNVEKNTDYVLSFKYYAPEKAIISGTLQNNLANPKNSITSIGIVKVNGRYNYNSDDLISYVARDGAFTGPYSNKRTNYLTTANSNVESWETLELPFNSGDLDKVAFVIQSGANTIYLENIKLEKRKMNIPGPGEPKDKVVVDFDSNKNIELQASDRMEITTAKNYEDKNSKMLHIFRNDYSSPTLFNADTTYNADKDNTFTFAVKGNTVYKITFRAKWLKDETYGSKDLNGDGVKENPWFAIYAHYSGWEPNKIRQMAYVPWARNNTWEQYTYYLTTDEKQDVFSFTFNAGQIVPETWIDDIVVEETDYPVFKGHTEPKQQTVINFDDYAVNSEYSERVRIDAAPEKNGNKNNTAMKFIAGRYEGSTCLNPTATRNGTDPVFAIPVKPSTLYNLSYWLYVSPDQETTVRWFKFWYFKTPGNYDKEGLIDATSMPERGEWVKFETTFVTSSDQTKVYLAVDNVQQVPEMWLDDIAVEEVMPGGSQIADDQSYCSDFYNILIDQGIAKDIESGKSGVYKVPVDNMTQFTFGATVNSAKSSSSRMFLSFDGVNPMDPSKNENPVSMVIKSSGEEKRYGLMFVSSGSGYIYVVVENDDNTLEISDVDLFRSFSISTAKSMGFETKPLEELNRPSELIKLTLLGEDDEIIDIPEEDFQEDIDIPEEDFQEDIDIPEEDEDAYQEIIDVPEENNDSSEQTTQSPIRRNIIIASIIFGILVLSGLAVIVILKIKKGAK